MGGGVAHLPLDAEIEIGDEASKEQGWGQGCLPSYEDRSGPHLPASDKDKVASHVPSPRVLGIGIKTMTGVRQMTAPVILSQHPHN